jgi:hypothetical protein
VPQIGQRRPSDEPGASQRGLADTDAADEPPDRLAARAHDDRSHRRVEGEVVSPDESGSLRGVRRATQEAQKRELLDGANVFGPAVERPGESARDRAGPQRVTGRLTGAEIRRE